MDAYLNVVGAVFAIGLRFVLAVLVPLAISGLICFVVFVFFWLFESVIPGFDKITNAIDNFSMAIKICFYGIALLFAPLGYHIFKLTEPTPVVQKHVMPEKIERFILVSVNPPKHMYVTLKHVNTGTVYERQYVAKHCSGTNKLGDEYNIRTREFYYENKPNERFIEFVNLNSVFCGS